MFYKAIGFVTWKLGTAYLRRRFAGYVRVVAFAAVASVLIGGYLAARHSD
jgi:hypothetical protein